MAGAEAILPNSICCVVVVSVPSTEMYSITRRFPAGTTKFGAPVAKRLPELNVSLKAKFTGWAVGRSTLRIRAGAIAGLLIWTDAPAAKLTAGELRTFTPGVPLIPTVQAPFCCDLTVLTVPSILTVLVVPSILTVLVVASILTGTGSVAALVTWTSCGD